MHRTHAAFQAHRGSSSTIGDADLLPRQPIFRTRDLAHAREYLGGVFVEARFAYLSRPFGVKHQTIHRRMSMLLAGSCFSSESAPRPFHHGVRRRGATIYWAALPSHERRIQATKRTHLIHRPARDIMPPRGGARVSSYSL